MTLVGEPFVFITSMPSSGRCEDLDTANGKKRHIKCSGKVYGEHARLVTSDKNDHCCYGMSAAAVLYGVLIVQLLGVYLINYNCIVKVKFDCLRIKSPKAVLDLGEWSIASEQGPFLMLSGLFYDISSVKWLVNDLHVKSSLPSPFTNY